MLSAKTWQSSSTRAWKRKSSKKPRPVCRCGRGRLAREAVPSAWFWAFKVLLAFENRGRIACGHICPDTDQGRGLRGSGSRVVWHGETRTERTGNLARD